MKALVKTQPGNGFVEIQDVEEPSCGENEALIEIKYAGICGSDLHFYDGSLTACIPPVILGHEFSGVIKEVGSEVRKFMKGQRVVAEAHKGGCGDCEYCLTGRVEICSNKRAAGYKIDGSFTKYIAIPEYSIHAIPEEMSLKEAALVEPLAVVVKGVLEKTKIEPGDFVVVLGCGPIGLLAAVAAKAAGAKEVVITGTARDAKSRLLLAETMGIDHAVNVEHEDLVEKVMSRTNGNGATVVVEASGSEPAIQQAFDIVKKEGRIGAVGHTGRDFVSVPWEKGLWKSVQLVWSHSSNWRSWERAIALMGSKKIDVKPLISDVLPLDRWKEAFNRLENLDAVKILLVP